nr:MAG TPA: major capsid protein [Caudoviricetes sp.]
MGQRTYTQDAELIFKDAGAMTASGGTTVAGSAVIKDIGPGRFEAVMLCDVSAMTLGADNHYTVIVQGSNDPTFATGIQNLAVVGLGNTAVRPGGAITSPIGRYELPFLTDIGGVVYRYVRVFVVVAGTTPSINFKAWASTKY